MCDTLELRASDGMERALEAFRRFHTLWAKLCLLHGNNNDLPRALAPLHGLESWFEAIRNVESAPIAQTDPRAAFIQARGRLRAIRSELAALDAAHAGEDPKPTPVPPAVAVLGNLPDPRSTSAARSRLLAEERDALIAYTRLRQALAERDPSQAALERPTGLRCEELARRLQPGEFLILTVHVLKNAPAALVVASTGHSIALPLGALSALDASALAYAEGVRASVGRRGLRDYERAGPARPAETIQLVELISKVRDTFWRPLRQAFLDQVMGDPDIRLHIVSGPGHHSLPLEAGNPGFSAHYYCGLPAYMRLRDRPCLPMETARTDILVDAAWDRSPIPFVEAEALLVERIRGRLGRVARRNARQFLTHPAAPRLVLSCHGRTLGAGRGRHGVLLLDAAAGVELDALTLSRLSGPVAEVMLSACLGAVVADSQLGDALGLVSALQVRGVSSVIACLAPVEDFYMPLLSAGYWYARIDGKPPTQALAIAKQRLRGRDWPQDLASELRRAYTLQMDAILQRARLPDSTRGDDPRMGVAARRSAESVVGWPMPLDILGAYFSSRNTLVSGIDPSTGQAWQLPDADHENFSLGICARREMREKFIELCLGPLFSKKSADSMRDPVQARIQRALDHICAVVVCFGGAHPDQPDRAPP